MTTFTAVYDGSYTFGQGNAWLFDLNAPGGGINGLDDVKSQSNDFQRRHGDGWVKGPPFRTPIIIDLYVLTRPGTLATVRTNIDALRVAWQRVTGATTKTLVVTLGSAVYNLVGAATELTVDQSLISHGASRAHATFTAYDATIT